jgi:hypothetical protein
VTVGTLYGEYSMLAELMIGIAFGLPQWMRTRVIVSRSRQAGGAVNHLGAAFKFRQRGCMPVFGSAMQFCIRPIAQVL